MSKPTSIVQQITLWAEDLRALYPALNLKLLYKLDAREAAALRAELGVESLVGATVAGATLEEKT